MSIDLLNIIKNNTMTPDQADIIKSHINNFFAKKKYHKDIKLSRNKEISHSLMLISRPKEDRAEFAVFAKAPDEDTALYVKYEDENNNPVVVKEVGKLIYVRSTGQLSVEASELAVKIRQDDEAEDVKSSDEDDGLDFSFDSQTGSALSRSMNELQKSRDSSSENVSVSPTVTQSLTEYENFLFDEDSIFKATAQRESILNHMVYQQCSARAFFRTNKAGVDKSYVFMRKETGKPLNELLESKNFSNTPAEDMLPLMVGLIDSVAALHQKGVVHGDIKPENIIYSTESKSANPIDLGGSAVKGHSMLGNITCMSDFYLAPEGCIEASEQDFDSIAIKAEYALDIYALAVVLAQMLGFVSGSAYMRDERFAQTNIRELSFMNLAKTTYHFTKDNLPKLKTVDDAIAQPIITLLNSLVAMDKQKRASVQLAEVRKVFNDANDMLSFELMKKLSR